MRRIDQVIIHSTATNPSWYSDKSAEDVVDEIRRWHVNEKNWRDIGYHYCIHRNGDIAKGRPIEQSGARTRGLNRNSVGVALVGGRGGSGECSDDEFLDHYTEAQQTTLRKLFNQLNEEYPIDMVAGHNEFASKACPCFSVKEWCKVEKVISFLEIQQIQCLVQTI